MKKLNEQDVIGLLKKKFGKDCVHRMSGLRIRGIPDVLISIDGRAFFLEIKIGSEKLTHVQMFFMKLFKKSAGTLYVWNEGLDFTYEGPKQFESVLEAMTG